MKISLAGDLGSGKSTVSKILMPRIGAEYYGTGVIARELAEKFGMDIAAFNIFMETHPEHDHEFDDRLVALSDDPRTLIIDSRMAWHFTRGTYRVYLTVDPVSAAVRIMRADRGPAEQFDSLEDAIARIRARKESEKKRYFDLYGVNCKDLDNYDLVVDTTYASPEDVADVMEAGLRRHESGEGTPECYICPRRFYYPDDEADMEEAARLSDALDRGETLPPVSAVYQDEKFFITDGVTTALAYALSERPLVPCRLVHVEVDPETYVKMEDSL